MSNDILMYLLIVVGALFAMVVVAYLILRKKLQSSGIREIQKLRAGTEEKKFSKEVLYQKLYVIYLKIPFIKRYLLKLRRRLEIINIDDEYLTRGQTSKILTTAIIVIIPLTLIIILMTHQNTLLMLFLLIFEVFLADTLIGGMVDKLDNKLLKQQINFFSEIRHAYHEYNMVEEAIYQVAQDDEQPEMSRQAEKIYEVLISNDPEGELEKYYDIAPNPYLKEFAGISYLTKEFGDRKVEGTSLYLKNLNNITQEMQLELLKRDKLDYVFQSLSLISIVPILFMEPIKNWAISQFSFTASFYNGKTGMILQILILLLTFVCYLLIRKLKDNGSVNTNTKNTENPWQAKLYKIGIFRKIIDLFLPKKGTKEYRKLQQELKAAASKDKIEWLYINRVLLSIFAFVVSILVILYLHNLVIQNVYTEPTADYDVIGQMSERQQRTAMQTTESDNAYIRSLRGNANITAEDIAREMRRGRINRDYVESSDAEIQVAAERVLEKIKIVNSENMKYGC